MDEPDEPKDFKREHARLWMLNVVSCDEKIGADGMCDCARDHFDALAERDAEIERLRDVMEFIEVQRAALVDCAEDELTAGARGYRQALIAIGEAINEEERDDG